MSFRRFPRRWRSSGQVAGLAALIATASVASAQAVPTPESFFGHRVGADYKLIDYKQSIDYFRQLAGASNKIKLAEVGKTSNGMPWTIAFISSPANLAKLDRLKDISLRIAHPAGLTDDQARALAKEGRAFVDISGGLHASEIAGSQHTPQLAYDLLTRTDDATKEILDNDVLILWPSINPDGQDIVVNWYRQNVGTPFETAPLVELYQKYIGHDNNRDAYMLNVVESRVVARVWREWEPQIIYVQHQSSPFPTRIWLPPFAEPIAPRVNPLMSRQVNAIGMTIAQQLETNNQPGATHMGTGFDAWYPGYIDYMPMLQNINAFWTETAHPSATPREYKITDFPQNYRDLRPGALYSSPWAPGWFRLRDAVEYMETASLATLQYAAKYKDQLLWNRYQAGRNTIAKYATSAPYGYVIPTAQRDPNAAADLLRRMAFLGVRVSELTAPATIDSVQYPAGTWIIPLDQEFGELVRQLFESQKYPDLREFPGGPPDQPYDAAGWTLPYQMDVKVTEIKTPIAPAVRGAMRVAIGTPTDWRTAADAPFSVSAAAAGIKTPKGTITGKGSSLAVDPAQNNAFRLINRAATDKVAIRFEPADSAHGARYLIASNKYDAAAIELGLTAERRNAPKNAVSVTPRVAIFRPGSQSMDEGWTEWLFDTHEFRFTPLLNAEVKAGNLNAKYDVIVFASDNANAILNGPQRVPEKYTGGIGAEGMKALEAFVRAGGTIVAINQSANFMIDSLKLPVKNVTRGLRNTDYFASGSILEVITDPTHPVMAGMPEKAKVFSDGSPVFTTLDGFQGSVLAKYQATGSPLMSGYLLGERFLNNYAAAVDAKLGDGHVILIGFRPQWRGQPVGSFRVLFNAALYGKDVASTVKPNTAFWTPPK
jgi:hypothetical protein